MIMVPCFIVQVGGICPSLIFQFPKFSTLPQGVHLDQGLSVECHNVRDSSALRDR